MRESLPLYSALHDPIPFDHLAALRDHLATGRTKSITAPIEPLLFDRRQFPKSVTINIAIVDSTRPDGGFHELEQQGVRVNFRYARGRRAIGLVRLLKGGDQ